MGLLNVASLAPCISVPMMYVVFLYESFTVSNPFDFTIFARVMLRLMMITSVP